MGRPVKNDRRAIVNAILYVGVTGCHWRALPPEYPHWNTVHHYYLGWMRDGTWGALSERLPRAALGRPRAGWRNRHGRNRQISNLNTQRRPNESR